ncbi:MAG: NAD(P)H-hydrate dehydratase [Lachnospiraceae bacterium]|nr:NAD(P)H-hydrate dehydratase [Lachnospiraceae bacterium]
MKQYLVTASEMKQYDYNTIEKYHIPALVLMERAALVTVEEIQRVWGNIPGRILVVSGCGNNGGDGLAIGRLLLLEGCDVTFVLLGNRENCTEETKRQIDILMEYKVQIFSTMQNGEYDIVIDAVFGVGLSRDVEGIYLDAIKWMNRTNAHVCSVDIPSGIHADTGEIMGDAVYADMTVTYGFRKLGHVLYPGTIYSGELVCRRMGIDEHSFLDTKPFWYTHVGYDSRLLPPRRPDGNKGSFGKALLIVGEHCTAGAAMMAAKSTFRIGAGMVKVVTAVENRESLLQFVPEAMLLTYTDSTTGEAEEDNVRHGKFMQELKAAESWADSILIGPGIGMGERAHEMLRFCIEESSLPLVIDADGLNHLAKDMQLQELLTDRKEQDRIVILTPHLGEFARLYGCSVAQAKEGLTDYPRQLSEKLHCIIVCKDARSVVVCPGGEQGYLNTTGNAGMATAGSGDVLAGMITGLLAQRMTGDEAAVAGVYLHGIAGNLAAEKETETFMTATDIIDSIKDVILLQQNRIGQSGLEKRYHEKLSKSLCRD